MALINVLTNFTNARTPEQYQVTEGTTAGDLVHQVLARHRMLSKDHHLLYVTMETGLSVAAATSVSSSRQQQQMVRESTELPKDARLLQRLHRQRRTGAAGGSRHQQLFVMHMRPGGLLKIHDSCIMPGSFYNSLYVSTETATEEVIALLLASYGSSEPATNFCLLVVKDAQNGSARGARRLGDAECPLVVQQQAGRQASIHLKRAADTAVDEQEQQSRSETIARLQASFRDLQCLRQQDPARYDKLLVASTPPAVETTTATTTTTTATTTTTTGFRSARGSDRDNLQFRYSVRRLPGQKASGCLSARSVRTTISTDTVAAAPGAEAPDDVSNGSGNFREGRRELWANRSCRSERSTRQQQQQSKRQLPQLPTTEPRCRRHRTCDFQCQAFEEAEQRATRAAAPSLREIFATCDACDCQLVRSSLNQGWGVHWQEVQFGGDINGNCSDSSGQVAGHKPAIGRRQGAFQRNESLLKYMRTLVAVQSIEENGAAAASDLRSGDLIVEINGCQATGLSPDEVEKLAGSQLTLDVLVARTPLPLATDVLDITETSTEFGEAQDLRRRLRRLQQQYEELAGRYRVSEQLAQRLKAQLTKTGRVCLMEHTDQRLATRGRTEAERCFRVIDAAAV